MAKTQENRTIILDNGNVYVCVTVESEENIAQRSAIQVGMSEEYASGKSNCISRGKSGDIFG